MHRCRGLLWQHIDASENTPCWILFLNVVCVQLQASWKCSYRCHWKPLCINLMIFLPLFFYFLFFHIFLLATYRFFFKNIFLSFSTLCSLAFFFSFKACFDQLKGPCATPLWFRPWWLLHRKHFKTKLPQPNSRRGSIDVFVFVMWRKNFFCFTFFSPALPLEASELGFTAHYAPHDLRVGGSTY